MRSRRPKFHGRKKPYTEVGIARLKCVRCGAAGVHQWQVCANNNRYMVLCGQCDIALNQLVLRWAGLENADELVGWYTNNLPQK